ncbi:hypothetical protein EYC80_003018 [Monilinia laxa]|uniref:Uncharacterized protein n=1 Tax=Monilinia laxa TaxID=61186 RepID=A0A5N6KCM4_MONLA|nr:hypothetical protein EYC80_003018 [Monilinia laxa]
MSDPQLETRINQLKDQDPHGRTTLRFDEIHYYFLLFHFSRGNNIQMYNFGFSLLKRLMFPSPRPNTNMDISEYHRSNRCTRRKKKKKKRSKAYEESCKKRERTWHISSNVIIKGKTPTSQ